MIFFSSKHRIKDLSFLNKLWMTPVAYGLKYLAGTVIYIADKFDEKVRFEILKGIFKMEEMRK